MFNVKAWWEEPIDVTSRSGTTAQVPRGQRICWLVAANGGPRVHQYGFTSTSETGHQIGLEHGDAIELMQFAAFMDGLSAAGVDLSLVAESIAAYLDKHFPEIEE